mmetsp:Transcript_39721/g.112579  ORF Transcript_39721/g.112579 Transcript_39721/m.112579 type:complete len:319 (+) Transcript_39721:1235-2191(+)
MLHAPEQRGHLREQGRLGPRLRPLALPQLPDLREPRRALPVRGRCRRRRGRDRGGQRGERQLRDLRVVPPDRQHLGGPLGAHLLCLDVAVLAVVSPSRAVGHRSVGQHSLRLGLVHQREQGGQLRKVVVLFERRLRCLRPAWQRHMCCVVYGRANPVLERLDRSDSRHNRGLAGHTQRARMEGPVLGDAHEGHQTRERTEGPCVRRCELGPVLQLHHICQEWRVVAVRVQELCALVLVRHDLPDIGEPVHLDPEPELERHQGDVEQRAQHRNGRPMGGVGLVVVGGGGRQGARPQAEAQTPDANLAGRVHWRGQGCLC